MQEQDKTLSLVAVQRALSAKAYSDGNIDSDKIGAMAARMAVRALENPILTVGETIDELLGTDQEY